MPSNFTPGVRQLLGLWGSVATATAEGQTTSALWATVRQAGEDYGTPLAGVTIQDMNYVRRAANQMLTAQREFAGSEPTSAITGDMMFQSPWSTVTAAGVAAPEWMVRYEAEFATEDGPQTQWMTSAYDLTDMLPATVGDLSSDLADDANSNTSTSSPPCGGQLVSIGAVQIMRM